MSCLRLQACTATPLGSYLKAIGVLRLVAEQVDQDARGWWDGGTFTIDSKLSRDELLRFFLEEYAPTPIMAPWNGGSGFYPKDNKAGIDAIAATSGARFCEYRAAIGLCRMFPEVQAGKAKDEDGRRTAILRRCRNELSDRAVEWLDAAIGIAADGSRSFAPVLGTGGNEGRLDYTNNFMARLAALLIAPDAKTPVGELLSNSLFGDRTTALQDGAAGQYDPGRAGGANQGPGVENGAAVNPWDLVLTLEGAVAWASGLYRRQGVGYRSILCSPFTVSATRVGYGSASEKDEARAEIWAPLWPRPVRYAELRVFLREGRASIEGRPARTALEFAEAVGSLGVDRGVAGFVRYNLLKRRGDSYVALPVGTFPAGYRRNSDLLREFRKVLDGLSNYRKGSEELSRGVESALYQALLTDGQKQMRAVLAAGGRWLRRVVTTDEKYRLPAGRLRAGEWLAACGFEHDPNVRIAAALASIRDRRMGVIAENLCVGKEFAWKGLTLPSRMVNVLKRRLQTAGSTNLEENPLGGACHIDPGDVTWFLEGGTDDGLIEDLLFQFLVFDWTGFEGAAPEEMEVSPVYAVLKCLFLPGEIKRGEVKTKLLADRRILPQLQAGDAEEATRIAISRLRIAGLRPLDVSYPAGADAERLAAALLVPVRQSRLFSCGIFHKQELITAQV